MALGCFLRLDIFLSRDSYREKARIQEAAKLAWATAATIRNNALFDSKRSIDSAALPKMPDLIPIVDVVQLFNAVSRVIQARKSVFGNNHPEAENDNKASSILAQLATTPSFCVAELVQCLESHWLSTASPANACFPFLPRQDEETGFGPIQNAKIFSSSQQPSSSITHPLTYTPPTHTPNPRPPKTALPTATPTGHRFGILAILPAWTVLPKSTVYLTSYYGSIVNLVIMQMIS
jgi:hypothetical protein